MLLGSTLADGAGAGPGDGQSRGAADDGDDEALAQHLGGEPEARGAERRPHGELLPAGRRLREQQIGDVDAGDEQHQRHRAAQRESVGFNCATPSSLIGDSVAASPSLSSGYCFASRAAERVELRPRGGRARRRRAAARPRLERMGAA